MSENFNHIQAAQLAISDFNYPLPDEKIAKYPLPQRDQSKLLVWKGQQISDQHFYDLPDLLPAGSLLLFNNTRVIRARLMFEKETGARIEIFCLDPHHPADYQLSFQQTGECSWNCMVGNLKKWKEGKLTRTLDINGQTVVLSAEKISSNGKNNQIRFSWTPEIEFARLIEQAGQLPIPPYLNRETEQSDLQSYQTVYSKIKGSVAAPTAGLHFTEEVFERLRARNFQTEELTLHVGAGTFQPVKSETIDGHEMHAEQLILTRQILERLLTHQGPRIAVGTTTIRTLESIFWLGQQLVNDPENFGRNGLKVSQWEPYQAKNRVSLHESLQALLSWMKSKQLDQLAVSTQIIIMPGYKFAVIDGMLTNFHQPQSTLLLLIAAFLGDNWKTIYKHALQNNYRFLSYGDSNLYLK